MSSKKSTIPSVDQSPVADSHKASMEQVASGLTESSVPDPNVGEDPINEHAFEIAEPYVNRYW